MQRCRNCNAEQFDGTIFCTECGASLIARQRRETTSSLGNKNANPALREAAANAEPVVIDAPTGGETKVISLLVINSGRRIGLERGHVLMVGRKDNARGVFPDVDLGLEGGYDAGVSRKHARFLPDRDDLVLEDLGSANGTFVNGQRLAPQTPVVLNHGDEIKFGTMIVRFERNG